MTLLDAYGEPIADPEMERRTLLLLRAFGALKALVPGRNVTNPVNLAMYREQVAVDIIDALGQRAVEQHFGISLQVHLLEAKPMGEKPEEMQ